MVPKMLCFPKKNRRVFRVCKFRVSNETETGKPLPFSTHPRAVKFWGPTQTHATLHKKKTLSKKKPISSSS